VVDARLARRVPSPLHQHPSRYDISAQMASDAGLPSSPPRFDDADTLFFEPPYTADYTKSSSPPPVFSSDDSQESPDVTNYESPRIHRAKRKGAWWDNAGVTPQSKKAKATRNTDSAVWMWSDASDMTDTSDASNSTPPRLPVHKAPFASDGHAHSPPRSSQGEGIFNAILDAGLDIDSQVYDFERLDLHDRHLRNIRRLATLIKSSPDPGNELPSEGQYRALIPDIYVNLRSNHLSRLAPSLFDVHHLTTLVLCNNQIEELPPQIGQLQNLRELGISRNKLTYLPFEFLRLFHPYGNLEIIYNSGVPWLEPKALQALTRPAGTKQKASMSRGDAVDEPVFPHHPPASHVDAQFPPPRYLARTLVSYYNQAGSLVKGSPKLPSSNDDHYAIVIDADHSTSSIPSTSFQPPSSNTRTTNSLLTMSLHAALRHKSNEDLTIPDLRERIGAYVPPDVDAILLRAECNSNGGYNEFRNCHVCNKEYVVARAEWIEWWWPSFTVPFPFKVQVCSWGCVPEKMLKPNKVNIIEA
jgi:hypothetical protein